MISARSLAQDFEVKITLADSWFTILSKQYRGKVTSKATDAAPAFITAKIATGTHFDFSKYSGTMSPAPSAKLISRLANNVENRSSWVYVSSPSHAHTFIEYACQRVTQSFTERGIHGLNRPRGGHKVLGPTKYLKYGS